MGYKHLVPHTPIIKQELCMVTKEISGVESIRNPRRHGRIKEHLLSIMDTDILVSTQQVMLGHNMAILPYCGQCKEPLVWHYNFNDNDEPISIHHLSCPKCHATWRSVNNAK
jgi:hypothetical protein